MHRLLLLGLNHNTAPLELRERFAMNHAQQIGAIENLRAAHPGCEFVLLSTCNRIEMYAARTAHSHPPAEELIASLANFHGIDPTHLAAHWYQHTDRAAVRHLFHVASSLDSMVLGESQILGQVRQAYESARLANATGPLLNPLFQRAVSVGKEVLHTTQLGEGRLSIAGVAADYARRIFDHFADKTILCIGTGKMARLALRGFADLKVGATIVCGRDAQKTAALAQEFSAIATSFESLQQQLIRADIVITSTGASEPIITSQMFQPLLRQRRYRRIFLIDIAMPRDVESAVGELDHVYLYNLDDLQRAIADTRGQRGQAVSAARDIVERHVDDFMSWHRQRELGPLIDQLYKRMHDVAAEEVARAMSKMPDASDADREHLQELARRLVNKLLHDPIRALRHAESLHGAAEQYAHAVRQLFNLSLDENLPPKRGEPRDA